MTDHRQANRRLWNEWSDDFQAIWNANTAGGGLPPVPSPFAADAPGGSQPQILDAVEGQAYVELGCGGGQGSVGTAQLGADPVVGVDFAEEQLAHARRLRELYGVDGRSPSANQTQSGDVDARFVQGDVTDLPLPDDRFDIASSEAAFQMIPDLDAALSEARRVLRPGGVFVFSVPHPLSEALDEETGTIEGDYLDPGPREITIDEAYDEVLRTFDRSVADLHNALHDAGFEVRRLIEHQRHAVEENDPEETDLPEVLWRVPQSVRFWAVAA